MMSRRSLTRGFTLIEVVVVVTILVLLAGVLIPIVGNEIGKARSARAQTDMKSIADAFGRYFAHTGSWPTNSTWNPNSNVTENLASYACLYQNSSSLKGWAGPYLTSGVKVGSSWVMSTSASGSASRGLVDPWGRQYQIRVFGRNGLMGAGGGMVLLCAGENGSFETSNAQAVDGEASGDDIIQVVTRRL